VIQNTALWIRPAARVLVVDAEDRVLLLRSEDDSIDIPVLWLTPGGACEADESTEAAARRELWEETGIQATGLGPLVWRRQHVWRWGDQMVESTDHFYFYHYDGPESVQPAAPSEFEQRTVREFRWWSIDELIAAKDLIFVPRQMSRLLRPLLSGEFPQEPLEIGE
jgi:8-oxo-dGTP pyrophosphatase MutT (NUDIX family)